MLNCNKIVLIGGKMIVEDKKINKIVKKGSKGIEMWLGNKIEIVKGGICV
jgi:hypothetical protein